jgi:hypothetical protein
MPIQKRLALISKLQPSPAGPTSKADRGENRKPHRARGSNWTYRVSAWESDAGWVGASTTGNLELEARDVVLSSTWRSSNVQGNNLSSQQVVSWCDIRWDLEVLLAAVGVDNISSPVVLGNQAILVDLEPLTGT